MGGDARGVGGKERVEACKGNTTGLTAVGEVFGFLGEIPRHVVQSEGR
jgi:hypothetical protein